MASTFSPNLRLELIGTGEQAGTWGNTTNTNLGTLLDGAIAGNSAVSVTSANQAFTVSDGAADQARRAIITLTTTTAANFNVYAPPVSKIYIIYNNSSYSATIYNSTVAGNTTAAGLGVTIPAGYVVQVWSDGTNFSSTDLVDPVIANSAVVSANSTGTALTVTQTGTGNAFVVQDESPDTTPFVIDNSGRVISGYTTYRAFNYAATPRFQINGTDATSGAVTSVISSATAAESGSILLGRSRGTQAAPTGLSSGDDVGRVQFEGYAGSAMQPAAAIIAQADGGVGATDMPGRLTFWTTLDGTATLTERMRIDNAGRVGIGGAPLAGPSTSSALVLTRDLENATSAAFGMYANGAVKATTTSVASYYGTGVSTASNSGSAYTIPSLYHFSTAQGTFHADSTVTNQYGFVVSNNLTGATTNVGVYGNLSANTDATISTVAVATNVVTIATTIAHGFKTGQLVEIRTATHPQLDGVFTVASTPSTTTFTYALTTPNISPAEADTGTAFNLSRWFLYNNASAPSWFAGRAILDVSSSAPALRITQRGTGNAITVEDSTNPDSTPFIVDTDGCVVLGSQSRYGTYSGVTPWLQLISASTGQSSVLLQGTNSGGGTAPGLNFANASSTNVGVVASGNTLGAIRFYGGDGTGPIPAAQIECRVDGTPGTNDMPGRIAFLTTADGASTPTEAMRINSNQSIGIGSSTIQAALDIRKPLSTAKDGVGTGNATGVYVSSSTSDVATTSLTGFATYVNPGNGVTLSTLYHFSAAQRPATGTGAITTQYGFAAMYSLTGGTTNAGFYADDIGGAAPTSGKTNYGFYSDVSTSTGAGTAWNFYANGTAPNFFRGNVGVIGSLGYTTGAGGTVTQATSRITGVTLNKVTGAITLVSAAGSTAWQSFTVTNSTVAATDTIIVNQKSGTDLYMIHVTAVAAGSFRITYATTGGTTTEQPVFNFAVLKGVTA